MIKCSSFSILLKVLWLFWVLFFPPDMIIYRLMPLWFILGWICVRVSWILLWIEGTRLVGNLLEKSLQPNCRAPEHSWQLWPHHEFLLQRGIYPNTLPTKLFSFGNCIFIFLTEEVNYKIISQAHCSADFSHQYVYSLSCWSFTISMTVCWKFPAFLCWHLVSMVAFSVHILLYTDNYEMGDTYVRSKEFL